MIVWDVRKIEDFGIGVYIKQILYHLKEKKGIVLIGFKKHAGILPFPFFEVKAERYSIREHFELPRILKSLSPCLFHSPHYVFPLFYKGKLVVTIHDTIHILFSHLFKPGTGLYARFMINKALAQADRIITVSKRVADVLAEMASKNAEKIKVIHNGIDPLFFFPPKKEALSKTAKYKPYILAVGNNKPHKGFDLLKRVFRKIRQKYTDLNLLFAGWKEEDEEGIYHLGFLKPEELKAFYVNALFLVHPALYEGFGLPPFEAAALKVPVISTPVGAVDEILQDGVLYVVPGREEDLYDKIVYALENPGEMKKRAAMAQERAKKLSWEKAALQHAKLYEELGCELQ